MPHTMEGALCPTSVAPAIDEAERELLSQLSAVHYEKRSVQLPSSGNVINTLSAGDPALPPLVVVHGWGAGVAFYGRNINGLSESFRVHFIDWLGFGASSRPYFSTSYSPEEAQDFFLDAFEEWIEQMKMIEGANGAQLPFTPFHLCGHSLGAYLSVEFALRRPDLVCNVVLASPVGVPRAPEIMNLPAGAPLLKRLIRWLVFILWDLGATPQLLIRLTGQWIGRALAEKLVVPRFPADCEDTRKAFIEYFYQISAAPGSGEHALSTILQSGAYARRPLCDKLPHVTRPVTFLYGDRDWMDWKTAMELQRSMKMATVCIVEDAGHHLYYDNCEQFNRLVKEACLAARPVNVT